MILVVACLVVVAVTFACGGRLTGFAALKLRWLPAVFAALAIQILVVNVLPSALPQPVSAALHLASYGMAAAFLLVNRRVPGLLLVGVGGLANLAAISANGGVMPASPHALRAAGMAVHTSGYTNSTAVAHARLAFLGDIFSVPRGVPLANVFSVGDVLLVVGGAVLLWRVSGARLRRDAPAPAAAAVS